jgi:hypothetical protein
MRMRKAIQPVEINNVNAETEYERSNNRGSHLFKVLVGEAWVLTLQVEL